MVLSLMNCYMIENYVFVILFCSPAVIVYVFAKWIHSGQLLVLPLSYCFSQIMSGIFLIWSFLHPLSNPNHLPNLGMSHKSLNIKYRVWLLNLCMEMSCSKYFQSLFVDFISLYIALLFPKRFWFVYQYFSQLLNFDWVTCNCWKFSLSRFKDWICHMQAKKWTGDLL
jgi:hypothetical protein